MSRGVMPTLLFALSAFLFFGLGNLLAARQVASSDNDQIAALRAEVGALRGQRTGVSGTSGRTADSGTVAAMDDRSRAALVADIKQQLKSEMGLLPVSLLRERRPSLLAPDSHHVTGASNYCTSRDPGPRY